MSRVLLNPGNVPLFCTNAETKLHWIYALNLNAMPVAPPTWGLARDLGTSVRFPAKIASRDITIMAALSCKNTSVIISRRSSVFWNAIYFHALYPSKNAQGLHVCPTSHATIQRFAGQSRFVMSCVLLKHSQGWHVCHRVVSCVKWLSFAVFCIRCWQTRTSSTGVVLSTRTTPRGTSWRSSRRLTGLSRRRNRSW